jgi:LuxR family maltose regulon positive regulatory protein
VKYFDNYRVRYIIRQTNLLPGLPVESNLINTKLYIPSPRQNYIRRSAILKHLEQLTNHKLTLVAAPPGYGKTTLLSIWAKESQIPVAWLSLDGDDNDPSLFFQYLISALQTVYPQVGKVSLAQLKSPQPSSRKAILSNLINDLSSIEQDFALVLDDFHWIETQEVHSTLNYLLDHQPEKMHLLIASRSDPPLSLSRLRARSQLLEVRQDDLRMRPAEAAEFFEQSMGLKLTADQVATLESRTEGWIAGLQLAALSLRGREDFDEFIRSFGGSHRYVIDYLADEVFSLQPSEIQSFLSKIAILDRICAPLCNVLTGHEDADETLHHLEESNLFLIPLDDQRKWYRFHHLFVDYLRTTSNDPEQVLLHKKAAQWFLENQLFGESVKHARAAGDQQTLVLAISSAAPKAFEQGYVSMLNNWLDSLPEEVIFDNSQLATFKGLLTFFTKSPDQSLPYAAAALESLPPNPSSSLQGQLMSLQAHLALCQEDLDTTVRLSRESLEYLDEEDLFFRNLTLNVLGQVLEMKGDVRSAAEIYRQAFTSGERAEDQLGLLVILTNLTFSLNELGQRTQALAFCEQLAENQEWHAGSSLDLLDGIYLPWSLLTYEANELETAREQVDRALEGIERVYVAQGKLWGQHILARIHLANKDYRSMQRVTTKGKQLARLSGSQQVHYAWFETLEAQANLDQGDIAAVEHWASEKQFSPHAAPHHWHEHQYLTYARLLITQERWADAEQLLASMEIKAAHESRYRKLITIYLLQAILAAKLSKAENVQDRLQKALALAEPQDYQRAFLDEGDAMIDLLPGVRSFAPEFVGGLLAEPTPEHPPMRHAFKEFEPLSEREVEIMRLVARGYSNRQIAEALFITLGTVKKHLNNIFGKLQVSNRTEATARSRELGLLE